MPSGFSHADLTIFGTVHVRGHRTVQTLMTAFYHVTNVRAGVVIGRGIATSAAPRIDPTDRASRIFFSFSVSQTGTFSALKFVIANAEFEGELDKLVHHL